MRGKWQQHVCRAAAIAALLFSAQLMAMSVRPASPFCSVIDGAKLPASSGRGEALCKAIVTAAGPRLAASRARVAVRVQSPFLLVAKLRNAGGRELPEMTFSISDKRPDQASFDRFAHQIALQLASGR